MLSTLSPALKEPTDTSFGYGLVGGTPEQFPEHARKDTAKWAEVVKRPGAETE